MLTNLSREDTGRSVSLERRFLTEVQNGYERRKDPIKVRQGLIDAATAMIADQGLARLTVDSVAKAAGVTKGGLFHHFPTKQALIDGVLDMMIEEVDCTVDEMMSADPEPHGRFTRALLNSVLSYDRVAERAHSRTLCLALIADPSLQRRWARWLTERIDRHAGTDDNISCAIVRLATDGLWVSSLYDGEAQPPVSNDVRAAMIAMTQPGP